MQQLFRAVDGAMIRTSACDPRDPVAAPWPEGAAHDDPAAWHGFIAKAWASATLASAVELASPSLAATIGEILSGGVPDRKKATRAGMALARYLVRLRGRATPFGLFAGVAPAPAGDPAAATWGDEHRLGARADARWLASLVTALEADGQLRRRLRVTASDLLTVRGNRIIVGWLPQASALGQDQPAEISLRRTPAAEAALRLARAAVAVGELAERVAAEFAPATADQAEEMISQLMACGALVSSVRPPSTAPDGLGWVLDALSDAGAGGQPGCEGTAALREAHSRLVGAAPAGLGAIAARMRELAGAPAHPVAVDLHAGCHVTISSRVADEAAAAASALARLSPHPHGASGWNDYRARFLDRYGTGTAVPVTDLLNPVTGLGLPAHYTARRLPATAPGMSGWPRWPSRRPSTGPPRSSLTARSSGRSPGQSPPRPGRSRTWTSRSTSAPPVPGPSAKARSRSRSAALAAPRWPPPAGSCTCWPAASASGWPGSTRVSRSSPAARSRRSCRFRPATCGPRTSPGLPGCWRTCSASVSTTARTIPPGFRSTTSP